MKENFESNFQDWPVLGSSREIALITGGRWTNEPMLPISAIRHRLDLIESNLKDFLFAPELFAKLNGTKARAALLASAGAIAKDAVGFIVTSRPRNLEPNFPCLIVDDPSRAIQKLAEHQRASSKAKFIAVTGSVGKTTTKNMIHHLASAVAPAHRSIANYNKGIESISFTLSNLSREHKFSTAEFNEIRDLEEQTRLYRPDIAVVTNILWEHVDVVERQGYPGPKAIPRLAYLAAGVVRPMRQGGICILNADEHNFDVISSEVRKSPEVEIRTFGRSEANDVRIVDMSFNALGSDIVIEAGRKRHTYHLGLPGKHMAINSVAAATAAYFSGIDLRRALSSFENFQPESRRGVRSSIPWKGGHIAVRDETFSSSIPSLRSSFQQLHLEPTTDGGRRIAVLGQVGDLGLSMPKVMADLAREADGLNIDMFYTIGSDIRIFNEGISDRSRVSPHCQTLVQLQERINADLRAGDTVLLKGSDDPKRDFSLNGFIDRFAKMTPAEKPAPESREPAKRILLGGDTYFGEYYQEKRIGAAKINYLETFGYEYSGSRLAPLFARADFAIANLECALTNKPDSGLDGRKDYVLRGNPSETLKALKALNIGGVLLGNNHAMDYLSEGLSDTLNYLSQSGIAVSGAGKNREEAQQAILEEFDVGGIPFKVAVLSGYEFHESYDAMGFYAGSTTIGVNNINTTRLREKVSKLKADGYFVIMSPHWGSNYCLRSHEQTHMAQRLVNIGVDLILGHGPHVMNEIDIVDGVWIVYSLGNLIFNSEGEYESRRMQPYSLIAEIEFSRFQRAVSGHLNLYPILSCNQLTQFQPAFVTESQFEHVVELLSAVNYDREDFLSNVALRKLDGRHCLTVKIF
jgi:UDP-N-acetylmuramyl pentapeptide synthase/poly-gamma-glutamate capsule biosynthesis protein CapA/YwtB (metallophosphatase superfamily)